LFLVQGLNLFEFETFFFSWLYYGKDGVSIVNQITVSYPETLAFSLKMQNSEFEREINNLAASREVCCFF